MMRIYQGKMMAESMHPGSHIPGLGPVAPAPHAGATPKRIDAAMAASTQALVALQNRQGWWCGELTGDVTLECDYILLQLWMHPPAADGAWRPPSLTRIEKAGRRILDRQLPDGGWNTYSPGPSEVNATVRAYTALKLAGWSTESGELRRARERALALAVLRKRG
jgi:squalene-hopene/tetraprenyl-beta-curcumene cyclase